MSGNEIQCKGWLEKWASYTKGYRTRWFILQGGTLSYYRTKTSTVDLTICKGSINLTNSSLVRMDMTKVKIAKEGLEPYYLKSSNEAEMTHWIEEISNHLSVQVSCKSKEEHEDDEYYGILTPSLAFTTCTDHLKLKKMQNDDTTLLGQVRDGVVWCAGMGVVDLFAPGATMFIKIGGSLYPSVFSYFKEQTDIKQELLDLKIENALLGHALVEMKADVEVIEDRYKQMVNEKTTLEDRKLEVVTVISNCKKILNCFSNREHVFHKQPMVVAPYFVGFASLYACVAQIAIMLAPHYKDELVLAMAALIKCLELYKQQVLLIRLGALACFADSKRAKAISYAKTVVALPVVLLDSRVAYAVDKISDKMYPCPEGGFREQIAYDRSGNYDGSDYREYRDSLQAIYASYFDNVIDQIHKLKLDIILQQQDLNQNSAARSLPYPLESQMLPLLPANFNNINNESTIEYGFVGFEKMTMN